MMEGDEQGTIAVDAGRDDTGYFEQRAAWHRDRALEANDDSTRALHERFSRLYKQRIGSRTSTFDLQIDAERLGTPQRS
jgi:hypothetical protein